MRPAATAAQGRRGLPGARGCRGQGIGAGVGLEAEAEVEVEAHTWCGVGPVGSTGRPANTRRLSAVRLLMLSPNLQLGSARVPAC